MNKFTSSFLILLIASTVILSVPVNVHATSELDSLVKICENTRKHVKSDIAKLSPIPDDIIKLYTIADKETKDLIYAVEKNDSSSSKQHFISAMNAFKKIRIIMSQIESNQTQLESLPDQHLILDRYKQNIENLKKMSNKLNANIDFSQIDKLMLLAYQNDNDGKSAQNEQLIDKIALEGLTIYKQLHKISEHNKLLRAKIFAQKYVEKLDNLILQAKQIGSEQSAQKFEETKLNLISANSTKQITKNIRFIIILNNQFNDLKDSQLIEQQKINNLHTAKIMKLEKFIQTYENKAISLSDEVHENQAAKYWLKRAFNLIDETKNDLNENPDLIPKKLSQIKNMLERVQKLIYTSS